MLLKLRLLTSICQLSMVFEHVALVEMVVTTSEDEGEYVQEAASVNVKGLRTCAFVNIRSPDWVLERILQRRRAP